MALRITKEEANLWQSVASALKQASDLLNEAELTLKLKLDRLEGPPVERLTDVQDALSGLAYMFNPQSEWMGGDSSNDKNFVQTLPHIARPTMKSRDIVPGHVELVNAAKDAISKIDDCADGKINFNRDFADRLKIALKVKSIFDYQKQFQS